MTAEERSAIEWLEGLDEQERLAYFRAAYPFDGEMFQIKKDHETAGQLGCYQCANGGELVVVE